MKHTRTPFSLSFWFLLSVSVLFSFVATSCVTTSPRTSPCSYPTNPAASNNRFLFPSYTIDPLHDTTVELWGIIDSNGTVILAPQYLAPRTGYKMQFSEGLAWTRDTNGHLCCIDTNGNLRFLLADTTVVDFHPFSCGLAAVCYRLDDSELFGFVNTSGQLVIPPQFPNTNDFHYGLASVQSDDDGLWGLIDTSGTYTVVAGCCYISDISEGIVSTSACDENQLSGYMASDGTILTPDRYYTASDFSEGLAAVQQIEPILFGYIDTTFHYTIKPSYHDATSFRCGLAAVQKKPNDPYRYIDRNGKTRIKPRFEQAAPFCEGLARVRQNQRVGFIDLDGNYVIPPQFVDALDFYGGLAFFDDGNNVGYINRRGQIIYSTSTKPQ